MIGKCDPRGSSSDVVAGLGSSFARMMPRVARFTDRGMIFLVLDFPLGGTMHMQLFFRNVAWCSVFCCNPACHTLVDEYSGYAEGTV